MTRLLMAILRYPLTGRPQPIDWNARLVSSMKPNPDYLRRRSAGKKGWATRKERVA